MNGLIIKNKRVWTINKDNAHKCHACCLVFTFFGLEMDLISKIESVFNELRPSGLSHIFTQPLTLSCVTGEPVAAESKWSSGNAIVKWQFSRSLLLKSWEIIRGYYVKNESCFISRLDFTLFAVVPSNKEKLSNELYIGKLPFVFWLCF